MGSGRHYICSKCGKEYYANWGVGFMFPMVYEETAADIKAGKYGKEWQDTFINGKNVVVDAERHIYYCKMCGRWESAAGLSLYVPKNTDASVNLAHPWNINLDRRWKILKRYTHRCSKCGTIMHKATDTELSKLSCPDCGGAPKADYLGIVCWD